MKAKIAHGTPVLNSFCPDCGETRAMSIPWYVTFGTTLVGPVASNVVACPCFTKNRDDIDMNRIKSDHDLALLHINTLFDQANAQGCANEEDYTSFFSRVLGK